MLQTEEKRLKVKIAEMAIQEIRFRIRALNEDVRRADELHELHLALATAQAVRRSRIRESDIARSLLTRILSSTINDANILFLLFYLFIYFFRYIRPRYSTFHEISDYLISRVQARDISLPIKYKLFLGIYYSKENILLQKHIFTRERKRDL